MENSLPDQFQPKLKILIEFKNFIVKTATTPEDLKKVFKLRHQVFFEECLNSKTKSSLDFDFHDKYADHLMIIERTTDQVVGVYRVIHSKFSNLFYSKNEFYLDNFLKINDSKIELSRVCTHIDFRNGRTIDLLWRGLSQYIMKTKTRFLFGCSSIHTVDEQFLLPIYKSLIKRKSVDFKMGIEPLEKYKIKSFKEKLEKTTEGPSPFRLLPPLLRFYLQAGSKIYGYPALDEDFQCFDLFTILDLTQVNKKFKKWYLV